MSTALQLENFVGGARVGTLAGEVLPLVDPSTGEEFGASPVTRWMDVDAAMHVAAGAFESWAVTTPHERQRALLAWADAMESRVEDLVSAECRVTGKQRSQVAEVELPLAVDAVRFYASAVRLLEGGAAGEYVPGSTSFARREPIGVIAQVTSWTHPLLLAASKIAPAVAAGNTVVIKPAETTPMSTLLLVELAAECFPPGVVNVICGDRDSGRAMVAHAVPGMFSITGTVRSGMEVAGAVAADLKRAHLQLGGKAPAVVFEDADVDAAADCLCAAAFGNAGQSCTAPSRVLVADEVYDEVVEAVASRARWMRPGPPEDTGAAFGPVNSAGQRDVVESHLERLPAHARIVAGGRRLDGPGFFHEATVVADVEQEDELVQHEVLGPVMSVQRFSGEQQAVEWANGVRYGLVASVWTRDHARAMRLSRQMQAGTVWINTHDQVVAEMPHSGFKHSASARDFGRFGLEEYSRIKHVLSHWGE